VLQWLQRCGPDTPGVNAAFADGSVKWLDADTDPEIIKSLLTATGGEDLAASWHDP
jgi:prepilin-type processing-associated H-X9-DG protein